MSWTRHATAGRAATGWQPVVGAGLAGEKQIGKCEGLLKAGSDPLAGRACELRGFARSLRPRRGLRSGSMARGECELRLRQQGVRVNGHTAPAPLRDPAAGGSSMRTHTSGGLRERRAIVCCRCGSWMEPKNHDGKRLREGREMPRWYRLEA